MKTSSESKERFLTSRNDKGCNLTYELISNTKFPQDEKKFSGIGKLEEQIKKDIEKAKLIFSKRSDSLYL